MSDIDREIAEKVMGFKRVPLDGSNPNENRLCGYWKNNAQLYKYESDFSPSTDIADAWIAVEKMRELGYDIEIFFLKDKWFCVFDKKYKTRIIKWHKAEAETTPMAISLAALQAINNQSKD